MDLVYIDEHNLLGSNYYWQKHADYDVSREEVIAAGLTDNRAQVDQSLIRPLQQIDAVFQKHGYRLYVKEGYRPKAIYELIFPRRVKKFGEETTRRLVNIENMPHATGKTVDVTLWDPKTNQEVFSRSLADGIESMFIGFYKNKTDEASQHYQKLQDLIMTTMLEHGFAIGPKNEYFHFNYIR
jgi:D-alanyl-D-alanine dipeptidase